MLGTELSKGLSLSFSMMSQRPLHARHATLVAAVCPLANSNNPADLHTCMQPTQACTETHCQVIQLIHMTQRSGGQMIKRLFAEADGVDTLGCCPTPFQ